MNTDTASVAIERNAEAVFKFMSDPNKMDLWSLAAGGLAWVAMGLYMAVPYLTDLPLVSALNPMHRIG